MIGETFSPWLEVGAMAEHCIVIVKQFGPQDCPVQIQEVMLPNRCIFQDSFLKPKKGL